MPLHVGYDCPNTMRGEQGGVPGMTATGVAGDVAATLRAHRVQTLAELYALNGEPTDAIVNKHTSYLTPLMETFIRASPFFLVATADADGNCDVSPKGDVKCGYCRRWFNIHSA